MVVIPGTIDFSQVAIGDSDQKTVRITNTGEGVLRISNIELFENNEDSVTEFFKGDGWKSSINLAQNESLDLVVRYEPQNQVPDTGKVVITSNDPTYRDQNGQLEVRITTPQLEPRIFSPEVVRFDRVPAGFTDWQITKVQNIGHAPLVIEDIHVSGSDTFRISFPTPGEEDTADPEDDSQSWPSVLGPDESFPVRVYFSPHNDDPATADLIFSTNDPRNPEYRVLLSGNSGSPCIALSEGEVIDFNMGSIGHTSNKTVTIENCSRTAELRISSIELTDDAGGVFELRPETLPGNLPDETLVIPGRESANFVVSYTPTDEVASEGELFIRSNDPAKAQLRVPVKGTGSYTVCPIAVAEGRIIGTERYDQVISARPLQNIEFSGEGSSSHDGGELRYEWTIVTRPLGSQSRLTPNNASARPQLWLDVSGTYEVELVVYDQFGIASCEGSMVTIHVIPGDEIHIQLTWEAPAVSQPRSGHGTDVDLHYLHPLGRWNQSPYDIYWYNRQQNWGTASAPSIAKLDIDDLYGVAPENINHNNPVSGLNYAIGVYYYGDKGHGPADATIRVYLHGQLQMEIRDRRLPGSGHFWYVGVVQWPSGNIVQMDQVRYGFP